MSLGSATLNVINAMLFAQRYEIDDEDCKTTLRIAHCVVVGLKNGDPTDSLPWLRFLPLKCTQYIKEAVTLQTDLITKKIDEHERTFDPKNIRDFTDFLLDVFYKKDEWHNYGIENMDYVLIMNVIKTMLIAGFETSLTVSRWSILYLIHWPKYQEEIYQQMVERIGPDRKPTPEDRQSLPLMEAFIQETLRFATISHFLLPHKTTENTTLDGKYIPKNTTIIINAWQIHHDERYWNEPNKFNPYRWLDGDGKYAPQMHPSFIHFSAGKRSCFGEPMARQQLFTFLASIIHDFEILPNDNEPMPSLIPEIGVLLFPEQYTAIFKRRN